MSVNEVANFFDATGYYRVPETLPGALIDRMNEVVTNHFRGATPPYRVNAEGTPCRLDALLERDPVFIEALRASPTSDALEAVLGPSVEVTRHRHNHATVNASGDIPFRLHRDIQQWSRPLVSVFFYLEESTVENGCTVIVPNSHRIPYAGPQSGGGGGNWADEHVDYEHLIGQQLPIEMPRGGILLLNSLSFHSVGIPRDAGTRLSTVFACRASDELARHTSDDVIQLFGETRFVGNEALRVSGSLRRGDMA